MDKLVNFILISAGQGCGFEIKNEESFKKKLGTVLKGLQDDYDLNIVIGKYLFDVEPIDGKYTNNGYLNMKEFKTEKEFLDTLKKAVKELLKQKKSGYFNYFHTPAQVETYIKEEFLNVKEMTPEILAEVSDPEYIYDDLIDKVIDDIELDRVKYFQLVPKNKLVKNDVFYYLGVKK